MPELPEVTTTVSGINKVAQNLTIKDVWSDWPKLIKSHKLSAFKREIVGEKILRAERRAKNVLIKLSGEKTLLIHMKMTGHIMYGKWKQAQRFNLLKAEVEPLKPGWKWIPEDCHDEHPLNDPYNRFLHLILFQLFWKFYKMAEVDCKDISIFPKMAKSFNCKTCDDSITSNLKCITCSSGSILDNDYICILSNFENSKNKILNRM